MAVQKRTILCTWEIGGELGHISRHSKIVNALESQGYHVVVALKDLSRAYPFFCDTNATLLQAPVWLPKITLQRPIACLADTMLLLGYLETDPLHALVIAWQNLVDLVKPDLVIFDYSPTAMLALLHQPLPKILTGTGFADPVPGNPIADWRPQFFNDDLIDRQEKRVLQQINTVLSRQERPALACLADLFVTDRVVISTFPEFDPYNSVRKNADYCVGVSTQPAKPAVQFANSKKPRILVYLKTGYPQFEQLVVALSRCDAAVFIACPQGKPEQFRAYLSDTFQVSFELVNLQDAMANVDLFVGHGNGASVQESLIAGTPLLILPIQLEQLLVGKKIQECGVGVLVDQIQSVDEMVARLNAMLKNKEHYRSAITNLLKKYPEPRFNVAEAVKKACAELLD